MLSWNLLFSLESNLFLFRVLTSSDILGMHSKNREMCIRDRSTAFMNMQQKILAGVYENNYDFITIIANMIRPTPIGLLYLYGVQGVSKDLAEAKKIADADFLGLIGMIPVSYTHLVNFL